MSVEQPTTTSKKKSNNLKTLWHITMSRVKGSTHEERLESFYEKQAGGYDAYRKKLLHGREEMIAGLPIKEGDIWVDLGAGTGENAEMMGEPIRQLKKVYQVDLCQPLLDVARQRAASHGWDHVEPVHFDATKFTPAEGRVDLVTFSYSLTMIPDWFAAIDHAFHLLKPGGTIGVVDFYVSRKYPAESLRKHRWSTRSFWQLFFGTDNVYLSPDHVPYLHRKFEPVLFEERMGKVPYTLLLKAPHYIFQGRKPAETAG